MRTYAFEKLVVWQEMRVLCKVVYQVTATFPETEKFGLVTQLQRSAISVSSNIAEGSGRITDKDKKYFYTIAYASLMELLNQLILATDLELLDEDFLNFSIRPQIEKVSLSLYKLKN